MSGGRMFFLPYTPRADADERGYEAWLREVDNPFFNGRPGISHYSNWRVTGGAAPFTHFDFLLLAPDSTPEAIWADDPLAAFAAGWVRLWGVAPDADDAAANYHCYLASHDGGDAGPFGRLVTLMPGAGDGERWTIDTAVVGRSPWSGFARRFGAQDRATEAIVGRLIAAPDQA